MVFVESEEAETLANLDGTDGMTRNSRFVGDSADDVARDDSCARSQGYEHAHHVVFGMLARRLSAVRRRGTPKVAGGAVV